MLSNKCKRIKDRVRGNEEIDSHNSVNSGDETEFFTFAAQANGAQTSAQTAIPVAVGGLATVAAPIAVLASQFIINKAGDANNIIVQHNDQLANNDA